MCDNARGTVDHAVCRWARAVVLVTPVVEDVPTLMMWARVAHSSVGARTEWDAWSNGECR